MCSWCHGNAHCAPENMRKMFYRWLAAAKKARHKRLQLQAREEEFKLTVVAGAWDKWRERFLDIRLQPLVRLSRGHVLHGTYPILGRCVHQATPERSLVPVIRDLALEIAVLARCPIPCLSC